MSPTNCSRCGDYDLQNLCRTCNKWLCRNCHPFVNEDCTECFLEANYTPRPQAKMNTHSVIASAEGVRRVCERGSCVRDPDHKGPCTTNPDIAKKWDREDSQKEGL